MVSEFFIFLVYGIKNNYTNNKVKECEECGKLIEIKNSKNYSQKYCDKCKNEKERENNRKRFKKWYNKNKSNGN